MTPSHQHLQSAARPGFAGKLLRIFTWVTAALTVIAAWVSVFDPAHFWFLAVTGLAFPVIFTINLILLLYWLLHRKAIVLVPLLALLITLVKLPYVFQVNFSSKKPDYVEGQSPPVNVYSFNVRLFDLYNWTHNQHTRVKIYDFLAEKQPDILALQEFYTDKNEHNNLKELGEVLKKGEVHVEYPITLRRNEQFGIATYSSYPIVNKGVLHFDENSANICIFTDIKIAQDTMRVYNCHLQSVRLGAKEYQFLENMGEEEETMKRTRFIVGRLKKAFIKRGRQAEMIADHMRQSPYPVLLCGDFNDTPLSYTYKKIAEQLTDAWRESGNGLGTTYRGPIPGLRIDYIFHDDRITSYDFRVHPLNLSDHDPVSATLVIKP